MDWSSDANDQTRTLDAAWGITSLGWHDRKANEFYDGFFADFVLLAKAHAASVEVLEGVVRQTERGLSDQA